MEAEGYSGSGRTYKKTVALTDVAWIDPIQGQYANVSESGEDMFKGGRKAKNDSFYFYDDGDLFFGDKAARESEVRHSFTEISDLINETEQEKINRLKNATVEYVVASEKSLAAVSEIDVSDISSQQFEKLVFPLLDKLGAFGTHYNNVYDIEFNYSRKSGSRSLSHQMKISGKNFKANAIVQANLKELCKTAYPVEALIDEKPKENVHETQN